MQTPDQVRSIVAKLLNERGVSYAAASRLIGRNAAYIQQFITRGRPMRLDDGDRRILANFLGVNEALLGAPEITASVGGKTVAVKRMIVEAAAGFGAAVNQEYAIGSFGFEERWLREITGAAPDQLSTIRIRGDSMQPTLMDGDEALVDQSRCDPRNGDGIYVLRKDEMLMVKRLTVAPSSGLLTISSDNQAYPTWRDCAPDTLSVIGLIIATLRRFR